MANIEKHCKWYFPPFVPGMDEQNTTSSDEETLKNQTSIDALVRESGQNSLDVRDLESDKPVVIEYRFGRIYKPKESIPAFMQIEERIQGAKEYILSRGNENSNLYFDPMLSLIESNRDSFPYLCVSDYNTIGMNYSPNGRSRFFSFMNNGFNDKSSESSGGSYGIGKAAYYMFSGIRTILISSMYKDERGECCTVFKGSSKLTTHLFRGEKYYNKGHFDITNDEPVTNANEIPDLFLRKEMGTSIYIMGVDYSDSTKIDLKNKIVNSVLRNFWLAIHENKLNVIVAFDDDEASTICINNDKLKELMPSLEKFDRKGEGYSNPRPYYEARINAVAFDPETPNQQAVYFDINHDEYGHARFYLIKNDQKHDRIIKMRAPRMFVSLEKVSGKRGFNGLLVCDDSWDKLLKHSEPPAHDNWERKRIQEKTTIDDETKNKAKEALSLITKWVHECISTYFNENQENEFDFYGIKDLLYTEKDFGTNSHNDGNSNSQDEGKPSVEEGEYGIATSKSIGGDSDKIIKIRPIASVTAKIEAKASPDKKGKLLAKKKRRRRIHPNPNPDPIPKPGTNFPVNIDEKGKKGVYREIFNVNVKCFIPSGQEDKNLYTMVINSRNKIDKAMVEITTGAAIGTLNVPIIYTDKGIIKGNRISDIPLEIGNNILHFKFGDNITHSVTVTTYEFK